MVHTFTGLPQQESKITVRNGAPGLTSLTVELNGKRFEVAGLSAGEQRALDVKSAMRPGSANTIKLTATGQPGSSATVVVAD